MNRSRDDLVFWFSVLRQRATFVVGLLSGDLAGDATSR
jgi:hypothetical protein